MCFFQVSFDAHSLPLFHPLPSPVSVLQALCMCVRVYALCWSSGERVEVKGGYLFAALEFEGLLLNPQFPQFG